MNGGATFSWPEIFTFGPKLPSVVGPPHSKELLFMPRASCLSSGTMPGGRSRSDHRYATVVLPPSHRQRGWLCRFCQSRCSFRVDTGKSSQRRLFLRTSGAALVWCCPCRTGGPDCAPGWQLNAEIVALSGTSISRSSNRNSGTRSPGNKSRFLRRYTGKPAGFVAPVRHLCRGGTLSNEGKSARMKDSTGSAQACKG